MFVFKPNLLPRWSYILFHVYQFYHNQITLPSFVAVIESAGKGKKKEEKRGVFINFYLGMISLTLVCSLSSYIWRNQHSKFGPKVTVGKPTIMQHQKSSLLNTVFAFYCIDSKITCTTVLQLFANNFMYVLVLISKRLNFSKYKTTSLCAAFIVLSRSFNKSDLSKS